MRLISRLSVLVATAALVLAVPPALMPPAFGQGASQSDVRVSVDGAITYQKIDGFGVNANARSWNNGQLAPALDVLVDQMGAQIFRVILEKSDWQSGPDGFGLDSFNWDYYALIYESPKFKNLWGTLGYLNARHVPNVMLNLMGTIPEWMGGRSLSADDEDQWVKMVASLVYYGRNVRQVQFNLLSPMNEQDLGSPEGPRVRADQYARMLDKLTVRLAQLGLDDVRLVGPDTASPTNAVESYVPAMLANSRVMNQVDHFAFHSYSTDTGSLQPLLNRAGHADRDFWVTEFSAWCNGCDNGRSAPDEWSFARDTTDNLLAHLEHGASAVLVYEGYDSYYEHHGSFSYWGQLAFDSASGTYSPRKRFFTNAQIFRFVQPGSSRIASSASEASVSLEAFRDPTTGELTIVGHNSGQTDMTLLVALKNVSVPVSTLHLFQTTRSLDIGPGPDVSVTNGAFSVNVAADGFFTLTTLGK